MILGSSSALAASDSNESATQHSIKAPSHGKGLLSGILNPVVGVVDKTVSQIPVVGEVTGSDTVAKVAAPVSAVTDRVEQAIISVPVVGEVAAPVGNLGNAAVPPVVNIVDTVTTPVLKTVDKVAAPVVQIADPVIAPVTEALKPIVDGAVGNVSGGAATVVDEVLPPVKPSAPEIPARPAVPSVPEGSGDLDTPPTAEVPGAQSLPDGGNGPSDSPELLGNPGDKESVGSDVTLETADAVESTGHGKAKDVGTSGKVRTLADYLAARTFPGLMAHEKSSGGGAAAAITTMPTPGGSQAACGADSNMPGVGPCAPAINTSPASSGSFGAGASGAGGSGGTAAAHESYTDWFSALLAGSAVHNADWQLPASTPCDPGSTPG